ncbi:hypothetical protein [Candidatus Planktophila dulcis]|uniref:hypothetical protein n=1 Tax=Candidatus Planktophila dulcis TaxID=1884914 RepID=UPI003CE8A6D7
MIKSRAVFAAGAVFLSAALAVSFIMTDDSSKTVTNPLKLKPSQVLTWDCEYPEYKPETIMIYCGDGGAYIDKITWNSWSQNGASGTGEYYKNLCNPDCADGKIVHAPVNIRLSELTPRKGKFYLRTLDMNSASGKDFPWGDSGVFKWDVMEFAERVNWSLK